MTVWAAHPVKDIDISKAAVYGDIKYITSRYVYADEIDQQRLPDKVSNQLDKAVDQFDSDLDYLLIAGDHLQLVALAARLNERWGLFKVLRFDREAGGYFPVQIGDN